MIVSMMLALVVSGPVTSGPVVVPASSLGMPASAAMFGDPPVRIDLNERVYRPGDRARVRVETEEDGYLLVLQVDVDGNLRVLFPLDPFDDSYVRGDRRMELDGRGDRETFIVEAREGQGWIYAAYSRMPFQVERYALGDHWDYRRLSPSRLPESPEPELTELVREIARASFDYDIIPYAVAEKRHVATTVIRDYGYDGCFGCGYYGPSYYRSGITIHIGSHYRRNRFYGCWDAFWCDPYYYDPFYYRPRYVVYAPRYYHPYYYRPPIVYRPRYVADRYRPSYPGFGDGVPYRDRRFDGRPGLRLTSANTIYAPPPRRAASGFAETPARRAIQEGPGYDLSPAVPNRGDQPRRTAEPRSPEPRTVEGATPQRRTAEPRTSTPEARPSDRGTPERRSAEPRTPTTETRPAAPERRAEPRSSTSDETEARTPSSTPRRSIEARPARPSEQRPTRAAPSRRSEQSEAGSSRERSDRGPRSDDRASSDDRSSRPAARPAPSRSSGGSSARPAPSRSSGGSSARPAPSRSSGGSSARPAPSRSSGGSAPARSSGGGRRGSP